MAPLKSADAVNPALNTSARRATSTSAWWMARIVALALMTPLAWLLARLVWIYYFFGLFFFLVAGLLVGAVAFRMARPARPIARGRLLRGILQLAVVVILLTTVFEFLHFRDTVGLPPKFAEARNAAVQAGRSARDVQSVAAEAYTKYLLDSYPPGGTIGYIQWTVREGTTSLSVDGVKETVHTAHAGWVWPVRTLAAGILLAAGLWFGLESLRRDSPLSNVLPEGEEGEAWE
jgi:hypothetical protein